LFVAWIVEESTSSKSVTFLGHLEPGENMQFDFLAEIFGVDREENDEFPAAVGG